MDGPVLPISQSTSGGQTDADAAPIESVGEPTSIVYFASAEEISQGFTIALRAMGFEEVLLPDILHTTSNPEDG